MVDDRTGSSARASSCCSEHPGLGARGWPTAGRDLHVWTVNTEADLRALPRPRGRRRSSPTARRTCWSCSTSRLAVVRPWRKSPAPRPVRPSRRRRVRSARGSRARAARASATRPATVPRAARPPSYVARPFEGLPSECDLVAHARAGAGGHRAADARRAPTARSPLCSLLPMAAPAMVRDERRDLARAAGAAQLRRPVPRPRRGARSARSTRRAGRSSASPTRPATGPRLQDLVTDEPLEVTVHDGFDFWVADVDDDDAPRAAALEQANAAASPDRAADRASRRRTGPTSAPRSTCAG